MEAAGRVGGSGPARRGSTVHLTDTGRRIAEEVRARRNGLPAERMAGQTADERRALRAALPVFGKMCGPLFAPPGP